MMMLMMTRTKDVPTISDFSRRKTFNQISQYFLLSFAFMSVNLISLKVFV